MPEIDDSGKDDEIEKLMKLYKYISESTKVEDPIHRIALNNLGCEYFQIRSYNRAVDILKQVLVFAPEYAMAWMNLGSLYYNKKQYDLAIEAYRRARELDPKNEFIEENFLFMMKTLQKKEQISDIRQGMIYQKKIEIKY